MIQHLMTTQHPSLPAAVELARASEICYSQSSEISLWANENGFSDGAISFDRSGVQGFWCAEGNVALLGFRGSQSIAHWIRNFRLVPWRHPWGIVHRGFSDGVDDVAPDLELFLAAARQAEHVWLTGHSLGGALAVMAAAWLKRRGVSATVYTYGQPAAVFNEFAQRYAVELPGRYVRFVNQNDLVSQLPPFYHHFGIVKRIVRPGVLESLQLEEAAEMSGEVAERAIAAREAVGRAGLEAAEAVHKVGITAPLLVDAELPMLTDQEFLELQLSLGAADVDPDQDSPELEFALPSVSDHAISEYIRLLTEIRDQSVR
ncbi:MAG: lipase family protein [Candidatus Electrothrix aestuarii]|uniref:Lipase family protein n=1 Tax=Candidatus Electrothrix aestuarii TaxID=3062594 RepID=A0AAU8LXY9_9BACT|nr:lipase family protein [Candidatus Electrothrix aestuarii]